MIIGGQVRQDGAWVDLDPTLEQPGRTRVVPAETYAAQALPTEVFHRVTLRLVLEHWSGDAPVETTLVELARPAHELPGKTVHVGHVPLGVKEEETPSGRDASATLQRLAPAPAWLPLIAFDGKYLRGHLITAAGDVLEPSNGNIARFQPSAAGPSGCSAGRWASCWRAWRTCPQGWRGRRRRRLMTLPTTRA